MTSRHGFWWTVAATAAVLGGAVWLRVPKTATFTVFAITVVATLALTIQRPRSWNRIAFAVSIVALLVSAALADGLRSDFARFPALARAAVATRGTAAIATELSAEAVALQKLAVAALDAPTEPTAAYAYLDRLRGSAPSRSVVVVRGGTPFAWSGRLVAPLDSLPGPVGAVATPAAAPFYLVLYAIAGRGNDRARAEVLVHAERPADALADALDEPLVGKYGVAGFVYADPSGTATGSDGFAEIRAAGLPVLRVRAIAPSEALLVERALERGRTRGGLALAVALFFFLAATWRQSGGVGGRLAALTVALAAVGIVPLSRYSNVSQLFDPSYFFVPSGGPFTGSVAALAITCAIVLLGMLAALRARVGTRTRVQAIIAVMIIAGVGPFLLRDLARGIQFPTSGVTAAMWIAWELTLFLAAVSVLIAGATAGQAALGARRGLPLWIAPAIAALAALLAPPLMEAPGAFPVWYPALWVIAIGSLALARRARGSVLPVSIVAACGAVTLVWGQAVNARVGLASRDVEGLSTPDPAAAALLQRFPAQLDPAHAPTSRVELLLRYGASDLSNADYPVELTSWDPQGHVIADLRVALGPGTPTGIDLFAHEAAGQTKPIYREALGDPGLHLLVLSVPHADHSVTTVVVAPRTRLLPRDPFGALIGLGAAPATEAPYSLRPSAGDQGAYISNAASWSRRGGVLHGDWFLPTVGGRIVRVHAEVELRDYEALVTRGALIVLFDLGVLALLWLLLVVADGAFGRWLRMRQLRWMRSYRTRLTLVLFAFFVLPAGSFAIWSYRRLQSDDQQARDLLVRETLRGVAASNISAQLSEVSARFETPLFLYANGMLVGASDPLFEALAPVGRMLPPAVARTIGDGDDVTASTEEHVGDHAIRFGFRATSDTAGVQFVLGAPARTDDLALDRRRRDLGILVLFATALGALGAWWLSGLAARQFSRPIRTLQAGARALAAGEREPYLESDPPVEFQAVFSAFRQMARDLEAGREQESRAQRVLAWGEMARQVAHEIKNPLTPMRLGMQHLRRARHDPRVDFDRVLEENVDRVLIEIDRLDEIARSFSRYGTAPDERAEAEAIDVAKAVRDVMSLEKLGGEQVRWHAEGADSPVFAMARSTEIREVLLNILENARLAESRAVTVSVSQDGDARVHIAVRDDGHGIASDVMPRIFEPHFSTRTSGSGLGLAISRRMIEGWGGTISVNSVPRGAPGVRAPQAGTIVRITLVAADPD